MQATEVRFGGAVRMGGDAHFTMEGRETAGVEYIDFQTAHTVPSAEFSKLSFGSLAVWDATNHAAIEPLQFYNPFAAPRAQGFDIMDACGITVRYC